MSRTKLSLLINLIFVGILTMNAVAGKLAATTSLKVKQDTENTCFYGSAATVISILSSVTSDFESSVNIDSLPLLQSMKVFANDLGKLKTKHDAETLSDTEINTFISAHQDLIDEVPAFNNIKHKIKNGKFFGIINKLLPSLENLFKKYPFYTAKDAKLYLRYVFTISFLNDITNKNDCVNPKDIKLFDELRTDLNQQTVVRRHAKTDTFVLDNQQLADRFGFAFWHHISKTKLIEEGGKYNLVTMAALHKGDIHLIKIDARYNSVTNKIFIDISILGNVTEIEIESKCAELLFITFSIEKTYENYQLHISVRQYIANKRDHFGTVLESKYVENALIQITSKVKVELTVIVDFIKCTEDQIENQTHEIEVITQFIPKVIKTILDSIEDGCKLPPDCEYVDANGKCIDCKEPKLLSEGKCVTKCPDGSFEKDGKCPPCSGDCETCSNADSCDTCPEGKVLNEGKCVTLCPNNKFPVKNADGQEECEPCVEDCAICYSADKCTKCTLKFQYQGDCIDSCPKGTKPQYNPNTCVPCPDECAACSCKECIECKKGFYLFEGVCRPDCPEGFFKNELTNTCDECSKNCQKCTSATTCDQCNEGFEKVEGVCYPICIPGYIRLNDGTCAPCIANCITCPPNDRTICNVCDTSTVLAQDGTCVSECPKGQYVLDGKCKNCSDHCIECNSGTDCKKCESPYKLINKECVADCPLGFYDNNGVCAPCDPDKNCKNCNGTDNGLCSSCISPKVLEGGVCKEKCSVPSWVDTNRVCHPCSENCATCTQNACTDCILPYFLKEGLCVKDCGDGYTANKSECAPCENTLCETCVAGPNLCDSCPTGTFLFITTCVPVCPLGFFGSVDSIGGKCLPCSENCATCSTIGGCDTCKEGFYMQPEAKECKPDCPPGYYANPENRTCIVCVDKNCLECDTRPDICTDCKSGFYVSDGKCVERCANGSIPSVENNFCVICNNPCKTCLNTPGNCTSCTDPNLTLVEGTCKYPCPNGEFKNNKDECVTCTIPNCTTCKSDYQSCADCDEGFYLFDGKCITDCPPGYKPTTAFTCQPCDSTDCLECPSSTLICENCKSPKVKHNGLCLDNCPNGTFPVDRDCIDCPTECSKCTATDKCTECKAGYFLNDGECVTTCPSGTYADANKNCKPCDTEDCLICSNNGTKCDKCESPNVLYNNQCVPTCPNGTRKGTTECEPCDKIHCKNCDSNTSSCDVCVDGKYLYEGNCVDCPTGTYVNLIKKTCEECELHCQECDNPDTCITCEKDYNLDQDGNCVKDCPEGTIAINGKCETCESANCKTCNSIDVKLCDDCKDGFFLDPVTKKCVSTCPDGTYADPSTKRCEDCPIKCLTCTADKKCITCPGEQVVVEGDCVDDCPAGFVKINGVCEQCQTSVSCKKCSPNDVGKCVECAPEKILFEYNCIDSCPSGYRELPNKTCVKCTDEQCKVCDENKCIVCKDGFYLKDGQCVSDCGDGYIENNGECQECPTNCAVCNTLGECITCENGSLKLIKNGVVECVPVCPDGTYSNGSECKPCTDPKCLICSSANNCDTCPNGTYILNGVNCVTECPAGYAIVGKECKECTDPICDKCSTVDSCDECPKPKVTHEGQCKDDCPVGFHKTEDYKCEKCINDCEKCPIDPAKCVQCVSPKYIDESGKCVDSCPDGSVPVKGICEECLTDKCSICGIDLGICITCIAPNVLTKDNECVPECPAGTYPNSERKCVDCPPTCKTCDSTPICTSCDSPLELVDGVCKNTSCPSGQIKVGDKCEVCSVSHCDLCPNLEECKVCTGGKVKHPITGECVEVCPSGYFKENGSCPKCPPECLTCTSTSSCDECVSPKVLQNGSCIEKCWDGYVNVEGVCVECGDTLCKKCKSDIDTCIVCKDGYILKDGDCVEDCGEGYYVEDKGDLGKECKECNKNCIICENNTSCEKCKEGWFLKDGVCVEKCGDGYTVVASECKPCGQTNCDVCPPSNINSCIVCKPGFVKLEGICLPECPLGYFPNNQNECIPCSDANCKDCSTETDCNICKDGFYLHNDKCIPSCPEGYVANTLNECVKCEDANCKKCNFPDTSICTECKPNDYLLNNDCVTQCPAGTYPITTPIRKCLPCDITCAECTNNSSCTSCTLPFKIKNGECILECGEGQIKVDNKCEPCGDADCILCPLQINECTKCRSPKILHNGDCIEKCPDKTYEENGECKPCNESCTLCSSLPKCSECVAPKVLFNETCVNNCPDKYVNVNGKCEPCADTDCKTCSLPIVGKCTECLSKILYNGECITKCPTDTFLCIQTNTCVPCQKNCAICPDAASCTSCKSGFVFLNGECVSSCPDGYVAVNGVCQKCDADCKTCLPSNPNICDSCPVGKILYLGDCIDVCPSGTLQVVISGVKTCTPCSVNCLTCEDKVDNCTSCKGDLILMEDGTCVSNCPPGQVKVDGKCVRCTDPNCINCSQTDIDFCFECTAPKVIIANLGLCVDECLSNQFRDNVTGQCVNCTTNCKKCDNATTCNECVANTYPQKTPTGPCAPCIAPSQVISGVCQECTADNCLKCVTGSTTQCETCIDTWFVTNGVCQPECKDGFFENGSICKPCDENCETCLDTDDCVKCNFPFAVDPITGLCTLNCPPTTVIVEGVCVPCTQAPDCLKCETSNLDICIECDGSFILHEGECISTCPHGYYQDAKTLKCVKCSDVNCASCNASGCQVCEDGFYLNNLGVCVKDCGDGYRENPVTKTCEECGTPQCKECPVSTCTECLTPFVLTLEGECKSTCPEGSYKSADGKTCIACSVGCKECTATECTECIAPLKLFEGVCVAKCKDGYTEVQGECKPCEGENCIKCEVNNPGTCIECDTGFYLLAGACVADCPHGTFPNKETGKCEECKKVCEACENADSCTQCPEGFVFHLGDCISNCPEGFFRNNKNVCEECTENNCKICKPTSEGDTCVECQDPYILDLNNKCVTECPKGTKLVGLQCETCPPGCDECNQDECTRCKKSYYLQHGHCDYNCEDGFVGNCDTNICDECHPSCKTCTGSKSDTCLECNLGYVFQGDKCVLEANCAEGFYPNSIVGECVKCKQENCKTCLNGQSCKVCKRDHYLKDGKCVKNASMKVIHLNSILATPSLSYGDVSISAQSLFDTKEVTLWGVVDALGTTSQATGKSVLISLSSPSIDIRIEVAIDRSDNTCEITLYTQNQAHTVKGNKCTDARIAKKTFVFGSASTDATGAVNLEIKTVQGSVVIAANQNFSLPSVVALGDMESTITLTNESLALYQGHRISNAFYSSSILSNDAVSKITANLPNEYNTSCRNGSNGCKDQNVYIVISNGFNFKSQELEINDTTVVKLNDNVSTKFTVEAILYSVSQEGSLFKVHYDYEGFKSFINPDSIAVGVTVNSSATTASVSNGVITIPSTTNEKWVRVLVGVDANSQGVSYSIKIKNALTGEIYYNQPIDQPGLEGTTKLFNDAKFVSSTASFGVAIHLDNSEVIEVLSSVQAKTGNYACVEFNDAGVCVACEAGYQVGAFGKCESTLLAGCKQILDYAEIVNNEIVEIDLSQNILANQVNTFVIRARKLNTQIVSSITSYNLISIRYGHNIIPLVQEINNSGMNIVFGSKTVPVNFNNSLRGFYTFFIEYDNVAKSAIVTLVFGSTSETATISLDGIDKIILGDVSKEQIVTEFKLSLVCSKSLSTVETSNILSQSLPESDPSCIDVNYITGDCNECFFGKNEMEQCKQAVIGFGKIAISGKKDLLVNVDERIIDLKESIAQNVNSFDYLVHINAVLFELPNSGSIEIVRLDNETVSDTTGSNLHLFSIVYEFNSSVGTVKVITGSTTTNIAYLSVDAGKSIIFDAHFHYDLLDSSKSKITVYTKSDDVGALNTVILTPGLDRLQASAQLSIFNAKTSTALSYYAETNGAYLIPNLNLSLLSDTIDTFQNAAQFLFATPAVITHCEFVSQEANCIKCVAGFVNVDNVCLDENAVKAEDKGYHLLNEGIVTSAAVSSLINNPFKKDELTLACHFRLNYVKYDSSDKIIEAGPVNVVIVENEGTVTVEVNLNEENVVLGPFTNTQVSKWLSIVIHLKADGYNIYLRDSRTDASIASASGSTYVDIPEQILISNTDGSKSVANCHITEENYSKAVIEAPEDKSINCDLSINNVCVSSDWGLKNGQPNRKPVHLPNFTVVESNAPHRIELEDLVSPDSSLCSRQFTLSFLSTLLEQNLSAGANYVLLSRVNFGVNYIEIKQSGLHLNKFSVEIKSYYTTIKLGSKKIINIELPSKPENDSIVIILSQNSSQQLNVLIYDTAINYSQKTFTLDGTLDCLTAHGSLSFGEKHASNNKVILSIKKASLEPENSLSISEMFEHAINLSKLHQSACRVSDDIKQTCSQCDDNNKLVIDNNGDKVCTLKGSSFAYNLRSITSVNSDSSYTTTSSINQSVEKLVVSIHVSNPGSVDKVGLASIQLDSNTIAKVYSEGSILFVENLATNSLVELNNVFDCSKSRPFVNIVVEISFVDGITVVYAYDKLKESISSATSFKASSASVVATNLSVIHGYSESSSTSWAFKSGATLVSVNGSLISSDDVKSLAVNHIVRYESCRSNLSEDGFDTCAKPLNSDIVVSSNNNLFNSLSSIIKDYNNSYDQRFFSFEVDVNVDALNNAENKTNASVLFALDNNVSTKVASTYTQNDIISEATEGSCRLSLTHVNGRLQVSTPKRDIEVLDQSNDLNDYKNVKVTVVVDVNKGKIYVRAVADDLTIKQSVDASEVEGVNPDTKLFKNLAVNASINLGDNQKNTEVVDCEAFKIKKDHCDIDNCQQCLENDKGEKNCMVCETDFTIHVQSNKCLPVTVIKNKNFIN